MRTLEEDVLIANWWVELYETGDLGRLLPPISQPLGQFFKLFRYPTALMYCPDGARIWNAAWASVTNISPHVAYFSAWTAREKRGSRDQFRAMDAIYQEIFKHDITLISVTTQRELLALQEKLGYTIHNKIPKVFGGADGWVTYLTAENYEAAVQPIREKLERRYGKVRRTEHARAWAG